MSVKYLEVKHKAANNRRYGVPALKKRAVTTNAIASANLWGSLNIGGSQALFALLCVSSFFNL